MADPQSPQRPRRLWRVVFALSLAMNVAVVGIVLGVGLRDRVGGHSPRGFDLALGPIGQALEKEDRRKIGEALRRDPTISRMNRGEARALAETFAQTLRATPFSEDALADVLDTAGGRIEQVQTAARSALVERIGDMTDAERAALADRIVNLRRRRH